MSTDLFADTIFVLRAYFCDLCNPTKLSPDVRRVANKISLEDRYDLARDDAFCEELDEVKINSAVNGVAPGKVSAQKIYRASAIVTYRRMGISDQLEEWPDGWEKLTVRELAGALCALETEE